MESHSRMGSPEVDEKTAPSDAMASVASYASAPAPACFGEADAPSAAPEEESDPAYSPTIVELGLRKLPEGLGGKVGENVEHTWEDTGDRYDGWAVNGVMAGRGVYTFEGGGVLECDFENNLAQGKGSLKLPDGTAYKGSFKDGCIQGKGVLRQNGATYKGAFAENMFHGKGKATFPSGDTYSGQFHRHLFHGKGVYNWRSGKEYTGTFEHGKLTGSGVYTWSEGQKYTGAYVHGKRQGKGELAGAYGQHYEGEWDDGEPHGEGVFTSSNSEYVEGHFHRGRYVDPDKDEGSPTSGLGGLFGNSKASFDPH